jgi:hypothetical protein
MVGRTIAIFGMDGSPETYAGRPEMFLDIEEAQVG